jgi:hypothetical protein
MRIAHIIIVYKDPELIERIIRSMRHENFDFYIHVDKKVDEMPFRRLVQQLKGVYFVKKRVVVRWAGFSFIKTAINSIKEIVDSQREYDFINLISGQDYPIKSADYIYNFLDLYPGKSFLSSEAYPSNWWKVAEARFTQYHFTDFNFRGRHRLAQFLTFLMPKRKFPLPYNLYGGPYAAYWTLSIDAAKYVYDFLADNNKLHRFFNYTWGPDEFVINTIIMNSPFKSQVINDNCRYMDWSSGGARPKVLTKDDIGRLKHSNKLFARKFDSAVDAEVLDLIDAEILAKEKKKIPVPSLKTSYSV